MIHSLARLWNNAQIGSCNQPVTSNETNVSCSRKQRESLIALELTPEMYPSIMSQTG